MCQQKNCFNEYSKVNNAYLQKNSMNLHHQAFIFKPIYMAVIPNIFKNLHIFGA